MIAIIDYGVGNLYSLSSSLKYIGLEAVVTNKADDLKKADKIILPGVGAFEDAIKKLKDSGLVSTIEEEVAKGKYMLGICLGMQLLFEKSFEYGQHSGLGFIKGEVASIEEDLPWHMDNGARYKLKVPHIGWNRLNIKRDDPLFNYIEDGEHVYYVHSYYARGCQEYILASSIYDIEITGVVRNKNIYGTQFHPEKSGKTGLNILRAFGELEAK